ncbi:MAG: putative membrane protein YfcA [Sulfitobacter sp.]|jgi:uncharacterized protein
MDAFFPFLTPTTLALALLIAACGGFVKGVVGFAMPLVMISGLTTFIGPEYALAGLIIPTVLTNTIQALRQGPSAAWHSIKAFRVFLFVGGLALVASAQLVRVVPEAALQLMIGGPVVIFVVIQLVGITLRLGQRSTLIEAGVGLVAGAIGGMSGVWGPPTVMYLTALDTPKQDQMRIQGVIYGGGALALLGAHIGSGVLRWETLPLSLALVAPALCGMWLGGQVSDRIDQKIFRRCTLIVLLFAGANLVRRALF